MPQVVTDAGSERPPHFKGRDSSSSSTSTDSSSPLLKQLHPASSNPPAGDPIVLPCAGGRIHLHPPPGPPLAPAARTPAAPETPIGGADPDRPRIMHGQQTPTDDFQPAQLTGVPSGLQQMIAVSDASDREAHPFVYLWADPADATKMQEQMEIAAANAIAAAAPRAGKDHDQGAHRNHRGAEA